MLHAGTLILKGSSLELPSLLIAEVGPICNLATLGVGGVFEGSDM